MVRGKDRPIKQSLMAIVLLTCGAALVLACASIAVYETVAVRGSNLRELSLMADLIGSNSSVAISFKDAQAASETLETLKTLPDVTVGRIYEKDGTPFATYVRKGAHSGAIPAAGRAEGSTFSGGTLHLNRDIYTNGKKIGSVYLELELTEVNRRIARYTMILGAVLLVSLVFAFLVASRLQRTISGPILELAQRASSIRQGGDYTIGQIKGGHQEIRILLESFDAMLSAINQRDTELREHREHLEDEVVARTRELRVANAELVSAKESAENAKGVAETASRAKGEFLANMSHEIRTPMNGILGMVELAMETDLSLTQRDYLSVVKSSADGLLCLINDILDFSKIEAGKLALDSHPFHLHKAIAELMKGLSLQAHQKGLELAYELDSSVPERVVGDIGRVRQIITNLIGNAIKFTAHGEVVLTVKLEEQQEEDLVLMFKVRDTGIGIEPQKLSKIFEAFEQADTSTTRHFGGSGLGLSISKRLVELMQGQILVESKVGEGSTFQFSAKFACADRGSAKEWMATPAELRGMRVLVVDDNATNRRILHDMLTKWEMEVEMAESGPAALAMLRAAAGRGIVFSLIIVDGHMPEMDGFELVQKIRAGAAEGLNVGMAMMLTSAQQLDAVQRCQELEISEYALKPVSRSELLQLLLRALIRTDGNSSREEPKTAPVSTRPLRILLAEDNAFNQKVAIGMLKLAGHEVTVAANGQEAVAAYGMQIFDLVFMDIQMPKMDGVQAAKLIRQQQQKTGIIVPIIAMTAHAMTGDREKYLSAGMDDYVSKPISRDDLINAVARNSVQATSARGSGIESKPQTGIPHEIFKDGAPIRPQAASRINYETVLKRCGGDHDLLETLAGMFPEESSKLLAALELARATNNVNEVRASAHTLKGLCGMFEVTQAASAAFELETIASEGALGSEAQVSALRAELILAIEAVRQLPVPFKS